MKNVNEEFFKKVIDEFNKNKTKEEVRLFILKELSNIAKETTIKEVKNYWSDGTIRNNKNQII
jgi:hypothetical protein